MREQFLYKNLEPTETIREKADRLFRKVSEKSPADAVVHAVLDWDGERYHCSLEIGSGIFPMAVSVTHTFPAIALDKAELALHRKLEAWRKFQQEEENQYLLQSVM